MILSGKTKRIYQYLLAHRESRIMQKDVADSTGASPQLVNKVFKDLRERLILAKVKKNAHLITDYEKLLMIYAFHSEIFSKGVIGFYCGSSKKDAENYLKNSGLKYSLAVISAAGKRIDIFSEKTYAYILNTDMNKIDLNENRNGNLIVFPRNVNDFYMCGKISGFRVTPLFQTIADLLSYGDYKTARKLAKKRDIEI